MKIYMILCTKSCAIRRLLVHFFAFGEELSMCVTIGLEGDIVQA